MMEEKLRRLFDFQKFSENLRLAEMKDETEKRYGETLSDEELEQVNMCHKCCGRICPV